MTSAAQLLWRLGTWVPLIFLIDEMILGVIVSPVINAPVGSLSDSRGLVFIARRRARTERDALLLFTPPGGSGVGTAAGFAKGIPGDFFIGDNGNMRRLAAGELWVEAGVGGRGATDSHEFGPLPQTLVQGSPIAEWTFPNGLRRLK